MEAPLIIAYGVADFLKAEKSADKFFIVCGLLPDYFSFMKVSGVIFSMPIIGSMLPSEIFSIVKW